MHTFHFSRLRRGFTLVEMLVVLAIIGILSALLFPAFKRAQENGNQTNCVANLQQIGLAVQLYYQDEKRYPASLAFLLDKEANLFDPATNANVKNDSGAGGTGYFKGGKDALLCRDDDTLFEFSRSSYGDLSTNVAASAPAIGSRGTATDPARYVWNYYGYSRDGFAYLTGAEAANATDATSTTPGPGNPNLLLKPTSPWSVSNPIQNSLSNRFAPTSTIITHCIYHRMPTSNLNSPGEIYSDATNGSGARDIVLRLDQSAKAIDVSKFWDNNSSSASQWQTQNF